MRQLRSDYLAVHQEDASYYVRQQQQHPWDEADEELPIDVVGGIAGSDSLDNSHSLSSTLLHQRSCQDDSCDGDGDGDGDGEGSAVIKLEPLEPPPLHVPRKAQYNSSFSIESLLGT